MLLFSAVDIRGGRCVRLRQGDYGAETVYNDDPVAQAVEMAEAGAGWIHVVDLDGARSGQPDNATAVAAIASAVDVPVQAGGGVRTADTAEAWYASGVERVVLGTAALRDPDLVRDLARSHRVAVGLDARAGEVATDGWRQSSGRSVLEVARSFASDGVDAFVVTNISRDGTLEGPDIDGLASVLDAVSVDVVASGGVGQLGDLRALAGLEGRDGHRFERCDRGHCALRGALHGGRGRRCAGIPHFRSCSREAAEMRVARVIPCLDVDAGRVVKGVNFVDIRDAGDPVELAARYDAQGADELVFLDITASSDRRDTTVAMARAVADEVFIPFTIGGGIRTLDDARRLLRAGADKVSVNTAAVRRPELVREISREFGAQCCVVAIDARSSTEAPSGYEVFTHGGRTRTGIDCLEWVAEAERLGAGEILLTSMDRDGTKQGFELNLTSKVAAAVSVPVIASGGVGNLDHLVDGVTRGKADAVLAASIFHYGEHTIAEAKTRMAQAGIPVRPA